MRSPVTILSLIISIACMILVAVTSSCTHARKFTETYYAENEQTLKSIRSNYEHMYDAHPFSLELKDPFLDRIGLEIITDSIKYIYAFRLTEPFLVDTLRKYHFDTKAFGDLVLDMQRAHCTWITNLDYYENYERKELMFISVRHQSLKQFLKPEKYFTLAFFQDEQPVDEKQRLLDKDGKPQLRKINDKVYRRINPAVFYALTENYR